MIIDNYYLTEHSFYSNVEKIDFSLALVHIKKHVKDLLSFTIKNSEIDQNSIHIVIDLIKKSPNLKYLNLENNKIDNQGLAALMPVIYKSQKIKYVNLTGNLYNALEKSKENKDFYIIVGKGDEFYDPKLQDTRKFRINEFCQFIANDMKVIFCTKVFSISYNPTEAKVINTINNSIYYKPEKHDKNNCFFLAMFFAFYLGQAIEGEISQQDKIFYQTRAVLFLTTAALQGHDLACEYLKELNYEGSCNLQFAYLNHLYNRKDNVKADLYAEIASSNQNYSLNLNYFIRLNYFDIFEQYLQRLHSNQSAEEDCFSLKFVPRDKINRENGNYRNIEIKTTPSFQSNILSQLSRDGNQEMSIV